MSATPPSPWTWFYTHISRQDRYWTSLCSFEAECDGLLEPLSDSKLIPVYTATGAKGWAFRGARKWKALEDLLVKVMEAMTKAFPLSNMTPLLVQVDALCGWPSDYGYLMDTWEIEEDARECVLGAKAAFRVSVAKLTYASYLLPPQWLEHLLRHDYLTVHEADAIRRSSICQATSSTSGAHIRRAGLIMDVRSGAPESYLNEVKDLVTKFALPVWLYYGRHPRVSDHTWSAPYLPSEEEIARSRGVARLAPQMAWPQAIDLDNDSFEYGIVPSQHDTPHTLGDSAYQQNRPLSDAPMSSAAEPTPVMSRPAATKARADPSTRQRAGQTMAEFFRETQEEDSARMAKMGDAEKQKIERRAAEHAKLELPNRSHKCNVYRWEEELDGSHTRILVGQKHWKVLWADTAPSQRKYNPVRNEFDICQDFDPKAVPEQDVEFAQWDEGRGRFVTFYGSPQAGADPYGFSSDVDDHMLVGDSVTTTTAEGGQAGPSGEHPAPTEAERRQVSTIVCLKIKHATRRTLIRTSSTLTKRQLSSGSVR